MRFIPDVSQKLISLSMRQERHGVFPPRYKDSFKRRIHFLGTKVTFRACLGKPDDRHSLNLELI